MFSSDLSDQELRALLGHVHVPALLVFSTLDQYYPKGTTYSLFHPDLDRAISLSPLLSDSVQGRTSRDSPRV